MPCRIALFKYVAAVVVVLFDLNIYRGNAHTQQMR